MSLDELAPAVAAEQHGAPPFSSCVQDLFARFRHSWELFHPFEWPTGVDDRFRIEAFLAWMNDGIQRAAPAAADDLDVLLGIRAARHGPDDIIGIGRIDIVIHDDDVTAKVRAGMALGSDQRGLARMPGITLLDRDNQNETAAARNREPHTFDVGHARLLHLGPY